MSLSKLLRNALLSSSFCLLGGYSAFAQFSISDNFESADHPGGNLTLTGPTSGIPFYTRNALGGNYSVSIANDTTFNSNVLKHMDATTAAAGNVIIGVLPLPIVLANTNDFITLSFQFRFLNIGSATANATGFRFGIWGDAGTAVTGNDQAANSDNDTGYYVQTGVGASAPGNNNLFYNESGGTVPIGGGLDRTIVTASGNGAAFNDGNIHSATFTITRTNATTVSLSVAYDGGTAFTGTSSTSIRTSFNEIAFNDGFVATPVQFALDNVQVVSNVPEPGSALLCAFGVAAIAGSRRRKI